MGKHGLIYDKIRAKATVKQLFYEKGKTPESPFKIIEN
jgi:hypothetical protein